MAIVDDVPGALALVSRTSHARAFAGGAGCNESRDTFTKNRRLFGALNKRSKQPEYEAGLLRQATGDVIPPDGAAIVVRKDRRSLDDAVRRL
jgi:hypothetical protein